MYISQLTHNYIKLTLSFIKPIGCGMLPNKQTRWSMFAGIELLVSRGLISTQGKNNIINNDMQHGKQRWQQAL